MSYTCVNPSLKTKTKSLSKILSTVTSLQSTWIFHHELLEITHEWQAIAPYAIRLFTISFSHNYWLCYSLHCYEELLERYKSIEAANTSTILWWGSHHCTTSFNSAWTQVLRRFKPCLWRVGDSRWWGSLTWSRLEIKLNAFRPSTIP